MKHSPRLGERPPRSILSTRSALMIAVAGLAVSVTGDALAVSLPLIRSRLRINVLESRAMGQPASTVIVGNIEGGHIWETHEAFAGRVTKIWWPKDEGSILGAQRGTFFTAHATAAASAMATDQWDIPNAPVGLVPPRVEGFAKGAPIILSGGFAAGINPFGLFTGETNLSKAFTIMAMTDPKVAGFASSLLGIPPYPVATVVNASFGSVQSRVGRVGESATDHAFDVTVVRTDAVIVVAAGDDEKNPTLEDLRQNDPMDPGGAVGEPGAAYNVLTVGRVDEAFQNADQNSSSGRIGLVDWRAAGVTMLSSINAQEFPMGCPQPSGLTEQIPAMRTGVDLAAPGTLLTLAGSPAIDPPTIAPALADTAFNALWSGTSFASAIVAGIAAQVEDIGNKNNLWPTDAAGNVIGRGLATRAILINSADDQAVTTQVQGTPGTMGQETGACLFMTPLGEFLGAGLVAPEKVLDQLIANQVMDVREGQPIIADGLPRPMFGVSRNNFNPDPLNGDPQDLFRDDPPIVTGQAFADTVNNAGTPVALEWIGPWSALDQMEGTPADRPFVTFVQEAIDPSGLGGMLQASPEAAPRRGRDRLQAAASMTPVDPEDEVQSKPYGQPGLEGRPTLNIEFERFGLGSGTTGVIPGSFPSGGGAGGPSNGGAAAGQPKKTGWDIGRMGYGLIDYPLGIITPMSEVRATLVWNRTEVWAEGVIDSWQTTSSSQDITFGMSVPRNSVAANDSLNVYPMPEVSSQDFLLPDAQIAFALENLDLELWRFEVGGNRLVASSRQDWGTVERISVGDEAVCQPTDPIVFGNYFLRVLYRQTQFDLGGYRYCGGVQSMQLVRPSLAPTTDPPSGQLYRNVYPAEVPFAIAWRVDLAPAIGFQPAQAFQEAPRDLTGDGVVDADDMQALVSISRGDFNRDGRVDGGDIAVLLNQFGQDDSIYDLSGDGVVSGADISHLLARFGDTF